MDRSFLIFLVSCILIILQLASFFLKVSHKRNAFYLLSVCGLLWGVVWYFFYGFPLDEGIVAPADVPVFERGFCAAAGLLTTCFVTLIVSFLLRYRLKK